MCDGDDLFDHYRHVLEALDNQKILPGLIFNKLHNKFQAPACDNGGFLLAAHDYLV